MPVHTHDDFYSAASLRHQATGTITCYPTVTFPDTETTSPSPILIMPSARLGIIRLVTSINFKAIGLTQQGFKPMKSGFKPARFRFPDLPEWEVGTLLIQPSQLVDSQASQTRQAYIGVLHVGW